VVSFEPAKGEIIKGLGLDQQSVNRALCLGHEFQCTRNLGTPKTCSWTAITPIFYVLTQHLSRLAASHMIIRPQENAPTMDRVCYYRLKMYLRSPCFSPICKAMRGIISSISLLSFPLEPREMKFCPNESY
jgi:hypothetical protein